MLDPVEWLLSARKKENARVGHEWSKYPCEIYFSEWPKEQQEEAQLLMELQTARSLKISQKYIEMGGVYVK